MIFNFIHRGVAVDESVVLRIRRNRCQHWSRLVVMADRDGPDRPLDGGGGRFVELRLVLGSLDLDFNRLPNLLPRFGFLN